MLIHFLAFLFVIISSYRAIVAQTCATSGNGPCINSACPSSGYYCIQSSQICCPSRSCVDKVNPSTGTTDCPSRASLCNNSAYYSLMTDQCPKTCGRCTSSCVDLINPTTGVSDCPSRANLCNLSSYSKLMTEQCPKTCKRC